MAFETALKKPIIYWQYKNSHKFLKMLEGFIDLVMKAYPYEWWEFLDLDVATGYALDLIGQRIGVPRPKDDPESAGIYDVAEYENCYYDYSIDDIDLVKDDVYRYMLKLRIMIYQSWRTSSVESFYAALRFAFPDKEFRIVQRSSEKIIELHALSYMTYSERRALFSSVMVAPMATTLLITYDYPELLSFSDGLGNVITDGSAGNNVMVFNRF